MPPHSSAHGDEAWSPSPRTSTVTAPPAGVWRMALSSRFCSTRPISWLASSDRRRAGRTPPVEPHAAGARRHGPGRGQGVGHDVGQAGPVEGEADGVGLDPRQLEEVVDQGGQPLGLGLDRGVVAGHRPRARRRRRRPAPRHRPDAGQRRPQVVRHPGHQLAAGALQRPFPLAGGVEPPISSSRRGQVASSAVTMGGARRGGGRHPGVGRPGLRRPAWPALADAPGQLAERVARRGSPGRPARPRRARRRCRRR